MIKETWEGDESPTERPSDSYGERNDGWGDDVIPGAEQRGAEMGPGEGIERLDETRFEKLAKAAGRLSLSGDDGWGDDEWQPDAEVKIDHSEGPEAAPEAESSDEAADQQKRIDDAREAVAREHRIVEACAAVAEALDEPGPEPTDATTAENGDERTDDAVRTYTGEDTDNPGNYRRLNHGLRDGYITEVESVAPASHDLTEDLHDLPEVSGEVYRKIPDKLGQEAIDRYVVGETVVEDAYTSASFRPDLDWGNGNVGMIIESKHGRDIRERSEIPYEQEVLFDRFSRFEVVDKQHDEQRDYWTIRLREP